MSAIGSPTRKRPVICFFAFTAVLAGGCGDSGSTTVTVRERIVTERDQAPKASQPRSPHLGDGCAAETSIATEVEVSTVAGAVDCGEARRVLDIYYSSAPTNGIGSGGRLEVAGWTCITTPPPEAPLAGHCSRAEGSEFEMYGVGYAFRPDVENADCHLPPPDGAGQYNLRASDIDCDAAHIVLSEWEASCSGSYGSDGACHLNQGVSCRTIVKGIELAEVQCRGREDQLVSFETGA